MRSRCAGVRACWRCCISVAIGYSSAVLCRLGVIIVDEIYPKRHFFCTRPMYPYQVVGVGSEFAQRRAACGLGRCVGVSCFRLGRLQMLAAQARGEWCALEGLVGGDWLGERSPPV